MAKTIAILGASYAGLTVTHKLLKNTLKNKKGEYKIVLVSPTTHHYWNLASVRGGLPLPVKIGGRRILRPNSYRTRADAR